MTSLIAASVFFLLIHFGVSGTRLRDAAVARLGEKRYRAVFSLASVVGIIWMGSAYGRAPLVQLWLQPAGLQPVAFALVLAAFLFAGIGLATPGPKLVGMESKLAQGADAARGIVRITRHPFLWGVALWSFVHLVMNGDLASVTFFGSLLVLALGGTASIDAKRRRIHGDAWNRFAQATSNLPFTAIATGRNQLRPALREIGILRPVIAIAAFALFLAIHGRLFGAPLI